MMKKKTFCLFALLPTLAVKAFTAVQPAAGARQQQRFAISNTVTTTTLLATKASTFEITVDLPPSGSELQAQMAIDSILSVPTELVVVRYQIPFGLSVEPRKGLAVVTQAGPGGEQPGDVLRYTTQWTLGLPKGEGLGVTVAAFAGGLSWQCSMFNVVKAKAWEQVVEALTSNTESRTDEVVLIFERPLNGVTPPELQ
jgi:hypothetical protein